MQILAGGAHCHLTVAHTPQGTEPVGKLVDRTGLALDDYHFETIMMIHMDMGGGDNLVMILMLNLGHLFLKLGLMMVVYHGNNTDHVFVGLPFFFDEGGADQIPDRLGAVNVFSLPDGSVKLLEQFFIQGDGETF